MKKTVIKCTSRADWGRIVQWAEEIKPDCTLNWRGDDCYNLYYGFGRDGCFEACETPPLDYTVLELSDFIAYPVEKYMLVSDDKVYWAKRTIVAETIDEMDKQINERSGKRFVDSGCHEWFYAKPINSNQEKIDEIDKKIVELTKRKEELL